MEVPMLQLPPGDPGLIDKIVCQLKSHGIFDQFRKECIADVDTKPAYQNLRQRVEGSVSSFLTNQEWRADLSKNQLRDSLRKHIHESGFLDIGVERIVDQVVNPKIYTVFFPKVEDVVYGFLGIEKPKKGADMQNSIQVCTPKFEETMKPEKKFVSLKDLLPTDLDPISPEKLDSDEEIEEHASNKIKLNNGNEIDEASLQKVKVKEEVISDMENNYDEDEKEDDEDDDDEASPPFESLEVEALDANATPPILPLHSADMLDNITSSSSSSETKDLLQYGEVRKRYPDEKSVSDSIKKELDGDVEKYSFTEQVRTETDAEICTVKKEEREKKDMGESRKEWKKEKREEKSKDNGERKDEARSRKSGGDGREVKERHVFEKKRNDKDQGSIKQEKDEGKRSEKEEQRKTVKEEHRKIEKEDHRKSEKDEVRKTEKEKDELKKSEKGDKKHGEKDDSRKVDKERDSTRKHEKDKEDRKIIKERDEKRYEKDKKYVREKDESKRTDKDDHRKNDKEKDESRSEKEKSDSKKRDKKEERKPEKEEKKVVKEKDDLKKGDKDEVKRSEKEESRKSDKEKDRHRSGKEKSEHIKGEKDVKERVKSDHKEKDNKHGSTKTVGETSKKDSGEKDHQLKVSGDKKKVDSMKKPHHRDTSKTSSNKDKKVGEKEKKLSNTDDHRHERDKGKNGHRRSDRDKDRERERSQADSATQTTLGKEGSGKSSSTSSTPSSSSDGSKGSGDSSSSGGGGSDRTKEEEPRIKTGADKGEKQEQKDIKMSDLYSCLNNNAGNLVLKIKKPKIAANIYEVKKIIQVRKNLKKLERERLVLSNANANLKEEEAVTESSSTLENKIESRSTAEPPKVKRVKLGAVEQELRGEVESVLEKGLLDDEDGEFGEVRYLEDSSKLPDFVLYVHSLVEEAAAGDFSRIPSPTNSIATTELSDFEDSVVLSDIELSKEEEEVVTKLGGHVERKTEKLKSSIKSSPLPPPDVRSEITGEGSNKRPRRPNPRYNSGEYTVYSDEDVEEDMTDSVSQKKVALVDGIGHDHWKTPKEKNLEVDEEVDAIGHHEASSAALPTPENDAVLEDKETPVLSKRNQAAADERRRMGRRLGVRGPLRRVAGISPGTPDTFVMPLSPESDVSSASGDAGKKASLNTKAIESQYHQGEIDGEIGAEDYDDVRGPDDGDSKQSRLPLGPPLSSVQRGYDIRSHAGDIHQSHNEFGHPSSGLADGERRIDESPGIGPRRLRGTRSSSRVQQRYNSDDLYKPRPNITLGRRNRGRNSPTQDDTPTHTVTAHNCVKQGRRGSNQGSDEVIIEGCIPSKRRRR